MFIIIKDIKNFRCNKPTKNILNIIRQPSTIYLQISLVLCPSMQNLTIKGLIKGDFHTCLEYSGQGQILELFCHRL